MRTWPCLFLEFFQNSHENNAWVCNIGRWVDGNWVWDFKWYRRWFEWENPKVKCFLELLNGMHLQKNERNV